MITKKRVIVAVIVVLVIALWQLGCFHKYNYVKAKLDIRNNTAKLVELPSHNLSIYESLKASLENGGKSDRENEFIVKQLEFKIDSIDKTFGFSEVVLHDSITLSKPEKRGVYIYNDVIENYLNQRNGDNWRATYSKLVKSFLPEVKKEVFGFHTHWSNNAQKYYDYDILTALAYFGYELDAFTGSYKDIRDWKTSSVVNEALEAGTKVYLTVANFGSENNKTFLENPEARAVSIDSISALLNARKAHGVIIDFEGLPKELGMSYTKYIDELFSRLNGEGKKIAIALPGNLAMAFDIKALNPYTDYFIVMGKNYTYKVGEPAGPVAPLNEKKGITHGSLTNTVNNYLKASLPTEKFILTLPYYGFKWETETDSLYAISKDLNRLTHSDIKSKYSNADIKYDSISESAYFKYTTNGKHYQVWFDDAKTLAKKYDLINKKRLAGVGVWALGFDNNNPELWQLLANKFGSKNLRP